MPHMSRDKAGTSRDKQEQAGTMKEPVGENRDKQDQEGTNYDMEDLLSLLVPYWC